jgi:hypothetical protein
MGKHPEFSGSRHVVRKSIGKECGSLSHGNRPGWLEDRPRQGAENMPPGCDQRPSRLDASPSNNVSTMLWKRHQRLPIRSPGQVTLRAAKQLTEEDRRTRGRWVLRLSHRACRGCLRENDPPSALDPAPGGVSRSCGCDDPRCQRRARRPRCPGTQPACSSPCEPG